MNSLKSVVSALSLALLPLMILSFGFLVSTYQTLGNPEPIKQALRKSGVYEAAMSSGVAALSRQAQSGVAGLNVSDPAVKQAIDQAIPPSALQGQFENLIDNTYNLLQGKSSDLTVDFSGLRTKLADNLANYSTQHLASLPPCQAGQTIDPSKPLEATCLPPGFDTSTVANQVRDSILKDESVVANDKVDYGNVTNDDGTTLNSQLHNRVPAVYKQVVWAMYLAGTLALLCTAGVIWGAATWRNGLRRFGWIAISMGLLSAGLAVAAGLVLHGVSTHFFTEENQQLQARLVDALQLVTEGLRNWWLAYGLSIAGAGAAAVVALIFLRPPKSLITEIPVAPVVPMGEASRMRTTASSIAREGRAQANQPGAPRPTAPTRPEQRQGNRKIQL